MNDRPSPPRFLLRFFRWFCHPHMLDYIEGDLVEVYKRRLKKSGKRSADLKFIIDVLLLFRPGIIKPSSTYENLFNTGMIKNYFKIAWRGMHYRWQYSLVSISGLGVGMACCILIVLFVRHEQSFDTYHESADRIYRVIRDEMNNSDQLEPNATTPKAVATTTLHDMPEVQAATTLFQSRPVVMQYNDKQFYEERVYGTDPGFFKVFTFPLAAGNIKDAFATPQSILITSSTAQKYFGEEDPIGKTIRSEDMDYFVTGIVKDVPINSHFTFDILVPLRTSEEMFNTTWGPSRYHTYIKLKERTDVTRFENKFASYAQAKYERRPLDKFHLQPLTAIHLHSSLKGELEPNGDASVNRILTSIALFIIFMAAVNYINLATARSTKRAKEVGIRKTSGAIKSGLILQFLTESILIALCALVLAVIMVGVAVHPFNELAGRHIEIFEPSLWRIWLSLVSLALLVGVAAGLYPAVYLSSFNASQVLKGGGLYNAGHSGWLRKILVCLQFTISAGLIIGTTVVIRQMHYIGEKDPGFDKEEIIVIPNARQLDNRAAMEQRIAQLANVKHVGASSGSIVGAPNWTGNIRVENSPTDRIINFCQINYDYLDALGIRLMEGRQFSPDFPADTINTLILNEAAVKDLQLKNPIGQQLIWDASSLDTTLYAPVVGVISDFHFSSFHDPIKPFAFLIRHNYFVQKDFTSRLFIKTSGNPAETVQQIEAIWKEFVPHRPFSYSFLDDNFEKLHADEERFELLFSTLTGIGVFIVCLGLFSLVAYVTDQRKKEIGIRKVLGASVASIVAMLNKDFMKLIALSLVVASPVSFYLMNQWLEGFAYRIPLEWWTFVIAAGISVAIVIITTGYQSLKASTTNPIDNLRTE